MSSHHSVCPHDCPSACSLAVSVAEGRSVDVAGDPAHPVYNSKPAAAWQHLARTATS